MCPGKIPIGHSLTPKRLRTGYDPASLPRVPMPRSRAELLLTLGLFAFRDKSVMLLTQGLGPQPFHGRIVLLVNEWTNRAAEMLANFAAVLSLVPQYLISLDFAAGRFRLLISHYAAELALA